MTSSGQVVPVRSQRIAPCMTCPICHKLFRNATSINECLHTFCKKCIYDMITKEGLDCCPVCKVKLGCSPLEKLRADYYWQDIKELIFKSVGKRESKEQKARPSNPLPAAIELEEPDVPSVPLPARRKEKSLSSLVSQPKASNQIVINGRKKPASRKVSGSQGSTLWIKEPIEKEEVGRKSLGFPSTLSKINQNKKQNLFVGESSKQQMPRKGAKDPVVEPLEEMSDLWKSLNFHVGAADMTRLRNPTMPLSVAKSVPSSFREGEAPRTGRKSKEQAIKFNVCDKGGSNPVPSGSGKSKKIHGAQQKSDAASEGLNIPTQAAVNAASTMGYKGVHPIWFSLVASDAQDGDAPLPQIPSCYLRIKNPSTPVSYIQKYIVHKLNLYSEAEVEITMQGYPLHPNLRLYNLIDLWSQRAPKLERIKTSVGCSAEDFVMVLCYGRKSHPF